MKIEWEDHLTTFGVGFITLLVLGLIGLIIWGCLVGPAICGIVVAGIMVVYVIGMIHVAIAKEWDAYKHRKWANEKTDRKEPPYKSKFPNATLALLDELEVRYHMSTLTFMQLMVIKDLPVDPHCHITYQQSWDNVLGPISPLDMITWVGLINSIPEVMGSTEIESCNDPKKHGCNLPSKAEVGHPEAGYP